MQQRADSYYHRRASEEILLAAQAQHPQAAMAHRQLAALFLRAATGMTQSAVSQRGCVQLDMGEASREQGFRRYGSR